MVGSDVCLVCGNKNSTSHLNCRDCWNEYDGADIAYEYGSKSKRGLLASHRSILQLLAKGGNSPTPPTMLKLCFIASELAFKHGDWKPRNKLVAIYHQEWSQPVNQPAARLKPKSNRRRASFNSIGEELQAICDGRHKPRVPPYDKMREDPPGNKRAKSGHWVRSEQERIIADFLWSQRICFAYEVPIPVGKGHVFPDFLIPKQQVPALDRPLVLEHFGLLHEESYRQSAVAKLVALRKKCDERDWDLAFTTADDVQSDAHLQRILSSYVKGLDSSVHVY